MNTKDLPITTILTLLRRGETISHIAAMLHVKRSDVEAVMEQYYARLA